MDFVTASNRAKVVVNVAPWQDAMALKNAVISELSRTELALDFDAKALKDMDVGGLVKAAMTLDSAPSVYKALLSCLVRCTYNGEKITEATFEDEAARFDYYEVVFACMKANISPFFQSLLLQLKTMFSRSGADSQPSK